MTALVTGGGGFLGGAVVRQLVARRAAVRSFSRQRYPHLDALGIEQHEGDLADLDALARAVAGCEVVFHVAAKAGIWGPAAGDHAPTVAAPHNVIAPCRSHGARRLVFTSSPSVV